MFDPLPDRPTTPFRLRGTGPQWSNKNSAGSSNGRTPPFGGGYLGSNPSPAKYMTTDQKDPYFVAMKAFVEKDGKLLILKDNFGDWDLPGGRVKKDEFETPLEDVLKRKMTEELGADVTYTFDKPSIFMRHERIEATKGSPTVRIFGLGYIVQLTGGDIHLSPRHTEMLWVDPTSFKPEDYFTGGWLKGVQEYQKAKRI